MKKIFSVLLAGIMLMGSMSVFAIDENKLITESHYYLAKLYYCDAEQGKIVLKDVKATGEKSDTKNATALAAEYAEIPLTGGGMLKTGQKLTQEELNIYVDSEVWVVLMRNKAGELNALGLKFR